MKRALHIVLFLGLLIGAVSCVNVLEEQQGQTGPISIVYKGIDAQTQSTKGVVVTTANLAENYSNYQVYAFSGSSAFYNDTYTLSGSNFSCSNEHLWTGETLGFWIYPTTQSYVTIPNGQPTAASLAFNYNHQPGGASHNDASDSKDAIFAYKSVAPDTPVEITFRHAMASIKVVYRSIQIAHHIKNITVSNIQTAGSCIVSPDSNASAGFKFAWTPSGNKSAYSQDLTTYVTKDGVDLTDNEMTFFVVPQTGFKLNVDLDYNRSVSKEFATAELKAGETAIIYINDDMDFSQDPEAPTNKEVVKNPDGTYCITIDAYITGNTIKKKTEKAVDFVLVLDVSGSMDYTLEDNTKRITALKNAVKSFADIIKQHADENKVEHRVALVKFASGNSDKVGIDYDNSSYKYNLSQVVNRFTNNMQTIKDNVDKLSAKGGTRINLGMQHAYNLFNSTYARKDDPNVEKYCIVFTDGGPGDQGWDAWSNSGSATNEGGTQYTANGAVRIATQLKTMGVKVYTVGIFDGDNDLENERSDEFMSRISSNYSNVTKFTFEESKNKQDVYTLYYSYSTWSGKKTVTIGQLPWNGTLYTRKWNGWGPIGHYEYTAHTQTWKSTDISGDLFYKDGSNYYQVITKKESKKVWVYSDGVIDPKASFYTKARSTEGLVGIFEDIAAETSTVNPAKELTEEAYAYDIISDVFDIPSTYGVAGNITIYKVAQKSCAENGTITWSTTRENITSSLTTHFANKSLTVSGWNYSANCCGPGCDDNGHKLVIVIDNLPVKSDATGKHYTNEGGSGIYNKNGELMIEFNSPYIELK